MLEIHVCVTHASSMNCSSMETDDSLFILQIIFCYSNFTKTLESVVFLHHNRTGYHLSKVICNIRHAMIRPEYHAVIAGKARRDKKIEKLIHVNE